MTQEIPLHATREAALVDDEDYEVLASFKWMLVSGGYAARRENTRAIMMHRQIMEPPSHLVVDHLNGNRLDNRRSNLRVCTLSENSKNKHVPGENGLPLQPRLLSFALSSEEVAVIDQLEERLCTSSSSSVVRIALRRLACEEGFAWPLSRRGRRGKWGSLPVEDQQE